MCVNHVVMSYVKAEILLFCSIVCHSGVTNVGLSLECSHKDKQVQYGRCGDLFGV